jgi:putative phage-type endonuclease
MLIHSVEQQTPEWFALRCGVPSASNFSKIVTTKGEPSKSAKEYMYTLAGEAIIGKKAKGYTSDAMQHGIDTEPEAVSTYEFITGLETAEVGFVTDDDIRIGVSPDRLVGEHGLLEVKCPMANTHIKYLLEGKFPTAYFQQVQGQLMVTGREWCDFMSYVAGMKPFIVRVYPDKDFHEKLNKVLLAFCDGLEELIKKLK